MWDVRAYHMIMWYALPSCMFFFQKHTKFQFRVFKGKKWLKPCHIKKTKRVWCMRSYSTHSKPSCTTLDLWSCVILLWTGMMEYVPAHHTIICFSLMTFYIVRYSWFCVLKCNTMQLVTSGGNHCCLMAIVYGRCKWCTE